MPMLDEQEFLTVTNRELEVPLRDQLAEALKRYVELTGFEETNPNAVWHHRLSLYGEPCKFCGRPLRSPNAKLCGSCMAVIEK